MDFWVHVYDLDTHPWPEIGSWWATVVLALIAIVAAKFAYDQLSEIRKNSAREVQIANASLLMQLDKRWDIDLAESRKILAHTRDDINKIVTEQNPLANDGAKESLVVQAWTEKLKEMRKADKDNYAKLMAIISFFETMGLMTRLGYMSKEPIIELFGGTIISVGTFFEAHIIERANEMGVPDGFYKHARELCSDARSVLISR